MHTKTALAAATIVMTALSGCNRDSDPGLLVSDAWVREPPPGRDVAAGYLTLHNRTAEDRALVAASSDQSERVEIHETRQRDGMMRMRQLSSLPLPADSQVQLEPGGHHLMLHGLEADAAETGVNLRLSFDDGSRIELDVPVR